MLNSTSMNLDELINLAIETCDQLIAVLQQEKTILITGDAERLDEQNQKKTSLLSQLSSYDEKLKANEQNLRQAGKQLSRKWELLRQKLITCKQHSAVNGSMVNHCLKNTVDALTLLRSGTSNGCNTYSDEGKPSQGLDSRAIAKI